MFGWLLICLIVVLLAAYSVFRKSEATKHSHSPNNYVAKNIQYRNLVESYWRESYNMLKNIASVTNSEFELLPFLYAIGDISVFVNNGDRYQFRHSFDELINMLFPTPSDKELFYNRANFYIDISNGAMVRGDWSLKEIPQSVLYQPFLRCAVALGDILTNPECGIDYENAPVQLSGIFSLSKFNDVFPTEFYNLVRRFCIAVAGREFTVSFITPPSK